MPPPSVALGDGDRTMNRSPFASATSAQAKLGPGDLARLELLPVEQRRLGHRLGGAGVEGERQLWVSGCGASTRTRSRTSTSRVGRSQPGVVRTSPRCRSSVADARQVDGDPRRRSAPARPSGGATEARAPGRGARSAGSRPPGPTGARRRAACR